MKICLGLRLQMVYFANLDNPMKMLDEMDDEFVGYDLDFGVSNQYSTNFFSKNNNFKI
jgi:hypothetical protein